MDRRDALKSLAAIAGATGIAVTPVSTQDAQNAALIVLKVAGRIPTDTRRSGCRTTGAMLLSAPHLSTCARWLRGEERTQVDTVFRVEALRKPFVIALARLAECDVETTVRISMRAGA